MSPYGSRKFLLALLTLGVTSGLVGIGAISDTVYGTIVGALILAYMTANVAQKAAGPTQG